MLQAHHRPMAVGVPIVGIGCCAGGLDALERFFTHLPPGSGMAFVVVQHLLPHHDSALPTLLRRFTPPPAFTRRSPRWKKTPWCCQTRCM